MGRDSVLQRAEDHLKISEKAGIVYQTPEARASALLALAQSMELDDREAAITPAGAATEGGQNLGGTGSGTQSLEEIDSKLRRLRMGPRTAETQAAIRKLNAEKDAIRQPSGADLDVLIGG